MNRALELYRTGKLKKGWSHLDVGGGIGDLGFALRRESLFEKTYTLDISETNLQAATKKGNFSLHCDIDREGIIIPERVSAISVLDFIEHIVDPENFARECARLLLPGCEVFVNTPNIQFHRHISELIQGSFPHTSGDREVYHGGHLAFFTYADLCDIFRGAGFTEFVQFKDDEGYSDPPRWLVQHYHPTTQEQFVQACMRFGNPNLLFKAVRK